MVQQVTTTTAVKACGLAEDIHFNGEEVAVFGKFDNDAYTDDIEAFMAGLDALEAGAEKVTLETIELEITSRIEDGDHRNPVTVRYGPEDKYRCSSIGELREAGELALEILS